MKLFIQDILDFIREDYDTKTVAKVMPRLTELARYDGYIDSELVHAIILVANPSRAAKQFIKRAVPGAYPRKAA